MQQPAVAGPTATAVREEGHGSASPMLSVKGSGVTSPRSPVPGNRASPTSPGGLRAQAFLDSVAAGDVDDAFERIQRAGSLKARQGSLSDVQGSVTELRRSQRDLLANLKAARRESDDVESRIDNSMRRFTIANVVIQRMNTRCAHAKTNNFMRGSKEFDAWEKLRSHTASVMEHVRRAKLKKEVADTKAALSELEQRKQENDSSGDHMPPRRVTLE